MFKYQILVEYVGTNFKGWQVQKKGKTIQGLIQKKISKLLDEKIIVTGSGRTDAGVHAIEQSAHFDCKNKIKKEEGKIIWQENNKKIIGKINGLYPNPGGWFEFQGERYKIHKAELSINTGKAGYVLSDNLDIGCGENSIKIIEIQRQGKKVQKTGEFLLGSQIKKGTNLN